MTVKWFADALNEIQIFHLANEDVADYQCLLVQISRMPITNQAILRQWHTIWTTLDYAMFCQNAQV